MPIQMSPLVLNTAGALAAMLLMIYIVKALTGMLKTVKDKGPEMIDLKRGFCTTSPSMILHFDHTDRTMNDVEKTKSDMNTLKSNFEILISNSNEQTKLLRQLVDLQRDFIKR